MPNSRASIAPERSSAATPGSMTPAHGKRPRPIARSSRANSGAASISSALLPRMGSWTGGSVPAATFRQFCFLKTPNDAQRIIAFCRRNEAALFQGLHRIARRRQGPDDFAVFEPTQQRIAAQQIGLKLIAVLQMREQILFGFGETGRYRPRPPLRRYDRAPFHTQSLSITEHDAITIHTEKSRRARLANLESHSLNSSGVENG